MRRSKMTLILVLVVLVLLIAYSTREHFATGGPAEAVSAQTPAMKAAAAAKAAKEAKHEEQAKKALEKYKRDHPNTTKPDWVKFYNDWHDKHPLQ